MIKKKTYIDQLNRNVTVVDSPKRIISLVPSQTELLFDLGLEDRVVGITKFCIHPKEWFNTKTRVGGTKNINFEQIKALNPDLIIANKEENEESQIKALMQDYPVWVSDIKSLDDSLDMMECIGDVVNKKEASISFRKTIFNSFQTFVNQASLNKTVLYLIWKNPYMSIGTDTFIHQMLVTCGLQNVLENYIDNRYPQLTREEIKTLSPDVIFLSSEPYPFKEKHIKELQLICPKAIIKLVDGELFSWYGSRLIQSPSYFKALISEIDKPVV